MAKPAWVEPLGERVEKLMVDRLWNQATLAAESGLSQKTVSNVIRGRNSDPDYAPSPATVRDIMAAFGEDGAAALEDLGHPQWAAAVRQELESRYDGNVERFMREWFKKNRETVEDWMRDG